MPYNSLSVVGQRTLCHDGIKVIDCSLSTKILRELFVSTRHVLKASLV